MSPVAMMMIHNPITIAMGDAEEMEKAKEMLAEVKESIMNAYEIKSGMSRAKISHLMDAQTWMNANKALELGFIDGILSRDEAKEDDQPEVSELFSETAVMNSLMGKLAKRCRINKPETKPEPKGRSVDELMERLNLLKN